MRRLVIAIFALALAPFAAFFIYDLAAFQPHQAEIAGILENAPGEDREPPPLIGQYILAAHHVGASASTPVARELLTRFRPSTTGGMLRWHTEFAAWDRLIALHFSQDKIFGLYATLAYNGQGRGLTDLSHRLFGKPLSSLSNEQAATVVAFLHSPDTYVKNQPRLERRRDLLLARVAAGL